MYKYLLRPILFLFSPEIAHKLIFHLLSFIKHSLIFKPIIRLFYKYDKAALKRNVFGIDFPNPVGLAGGLDKNCEHYNELADFGFGFVEVGSLTPKAQNGNPSPRIFRLKKDSALINRMGIPNKGVIHAIEHLKKDKPKVIIAANIAKNTSTEDTRAALDYDKAFSLLYDFVDMFVINLSCPNVVGLTNLQDISWISDILDDILDKRMGMDIYKPVLIKISPDLSKSQIDDIIEYSLVSRVDGLIAGNTSRGRENLTSSEAKISSIGNGGLSGAPIYSKSLEMVRYISEKSGGRLPIIACGGIMSPQQAKEMLDAGASLIEIYTGFIYEGPGLIRKILKHLNSK